MDEVGGGQEAEGLKVWTAWNLLRRFLHGQRKGGGLGRWWKMGMERWRRPDQITQGWRHLVKGLSLILDSLKQRLPSCSWRSLWLVSVWRIDFCKVLTRIILGNLGSAWSRLEGWLWVNFVSGLIQCFLTYFKEGGQGSSAPVELGKARRARLTSCPHLLGFVCTECLTINDIRCDSPCEPEGKLAFCSLKIEWQVEDDGEYWKTHWTGDGRPGCCPQLGCNQQWDLVHVTSSLYALLTSSVKWDLYGNMVIRAPSSHRALWLWFCLPSSPPDPQTQASRHSD